MILHFMKCDVCDKKHRYEPMLGPVFSQIPRDWLGLYSGDRSEEGYLFCSSDCLRQHFGITEPVQLQEQSQTKMRRFWLVSGETADLTECIRWGNGCVTVDPEKCNISDLWFYRNWDEFKAAHEGCGVQWIDQEVSDAIN